MGNNLHGFNFLRGHTCMDVTAFYAKASSYFFKKWLIDFFTSLEVPQSNPSIQFVGKHRDLCRYLRENIRET